MLDSRISVVPRVQNGKSAARKDYCAGCAPHKDPIRANACRDENITSSLYSCSAVERLHADGTTRRSHHQPHLGSRVAAQLSPIPAASLAALSARRSLASRTRTCELFDVLSPGMSGDEEVMMGAGEGAGEGAAGAAHPQFDDSDSEDEVCGPRGTCALSCARVSLAIGRESPLYISHAQGARAHAPGYAYQVFLDPNDPSLGGRVVCELDGQDDDDDGDDDMEDEEEDDEAGADVEEEEEIVDVSKGGECGMASVWCGVVARPVCRAYLLPSSAGRIEAHGDAIYSVAVHPSNADLIATASGDDTGALWNRATKQRIATLSGHTDTVVQVAFNTSGSLLATAGMDGVVKVWNSADGALVATLEGPGEDITFINWHSKGDVLLAGSSDASVWMWNAASGSCMAVLSGHSESVTCGMFSQDGKTVMTASSDGSARVWNPKDSSCLISMSDPKVF